MTITREDILPLVRRAIKEAGSQNAAGRKLGVEGAYISQVMTGARGSGVGAKLRDALCKAYPTEMGRIMGVPTGQPAKAEAPAGDPVIDARSRAVRAYLELHPDADAADVAELADWAMLAHDGDEPHDARWWLAMIDRAQVVRSQVQQNAVKRRGE